MFWVFPLQFCETHWEYLFVLRNNISTNLVKMNPAAFPELLWLKCSQFIWNRNWDCLQSKYLQFLFLKNSSSWYWLQNHVIKELPMPHSWWSWKYIMALFFCFIYYVLHGRETKLRLNTFKSHQCLKTEQYLGIKSKNIRKVRQLCPMNSAHLYVLPYCVYLLVS